MLDTRDVTLSRPLQGRWAIPAREHVVAGGKEEERKRERGISGRS